MQFTYTEEHGEEKPYQWYANYVKQYAKEKYGLELKVEINPKYLTETPDEK